MNATKDRFYTLADELGYTKDEATAMLEGDKRRKDTWLQGIEKLQQQVSERNKAEADYVDEEPAWRMVELSTGHTIFGLDVDVSGDEQHNVLKLVNTYTDTLDLQYLLDSYGVTERWSTLSEGRLLAFKAMVMGLLKDKQANKSEEVVTSSQCQHTLFWQGANAEWGATNPYDRSLPGYWDWQNGYDTYHVTDEASVRIRYRWQSRLGLLSTLRKAGAI